MKLGDLQAFVESLGALFASKTGNPQKDMIELHHALEPFKELSLPDFAEFLRLAKEYKETGKIPTAVARRRASGTRAGGGAKTPLKTLADSGAIEEAVSNLEKLYENAADPDLDYSTIEATVSEIEKSFNAAALKEIAKRFQITSGTNTKKACGQKIANKIKERKARLERGEIISERARTEQSEAPTGFPSQTEAQEVLEATIVDD